MAAIEVLEHNGSRFMWIEGYLWMWDTPQERELQMELAGKAFGDCLVAGYGFGILTKYLLENSKVKSVVTVEKYKEVISEMEKRGKIHGRVIISDFYDLPEGKKFDCIVGDIWPDIAAKFLADYVKFKGKSKKLLRKNGLVLAWGEEFFEYLLKNESNRLL